MGTHRPVAWCWIILVASAAAAWAQVTEPSQSPTLKQAARGLFDIGVGVHDRIADRPEDHPLLLAQLGMVTRGNGRKPAEVQAAEGQWDFAQADAFVAFAN